MSAVVLAVSALVLRRGSRQILNGVSFDVRRGEIVALMGASGSGKSTILRAIAGLEPFDSGELRVDDVVVPAGRATPRVLRELRRRVGMVFQFHCLFEHLPALQNVALALLHVQGLTRQAADDRARRLLRDLGVEHRATALPRELSGGEAQRVAIARALATEPPMLLMDEPTASLDPTRRLELAALTKSLAGRDRTLLIVTHDEDFAAAAASRVLHMRDGRIAEEPGRGS